MKKMMLVLTVVTVVSGLVLASAYTVFLPRIQFNQQQALERSLASLFEEAQEPSFETLETETMTVYRATSAAGELLGFAVRAVTTGYGGEIQLLVALDAGVSTITGMEVVEQVETPGLGARIDEEWFKEQFEGLNAGEEVSYVKNEEPDPAENEIQAISGATISTEAVVEGINRALSRLPDVLPKESEA